MPLPTNLTTNEVKDRAGVEIEFNHRSLEGRTHIYAKNGEIPSLAHRLKVSHQETGSGLQTVRRSLVRVDRDVVGKSGKVQTLSAYAVVVLPVGELDNYDTAKDTLANLLSFCATTGAATTVLFDCSGCGADSLINGTV